MPPRKDLLRRGLFAFRDAGLQAMGVGIMILGAVIFSILALGLSRVLGARFGILGWILFGLIIVSWSMWFAPFVVAGIGVRRAGSAKYRAEAAARHAEQRLKFGLDKPAVAKPVHHHVRVSQHDKDPPP